MRFLSNPIVRNLAAVIGGAAMAQAVAFAFSPIITRIYSPSAFGTQGVFIASISLLWPFAALRYPMAIVVAESESEVRSLVRLSLLIAAAVSCAIAIFLLAFRQPLLSLFGMEQVGALIWLLPLALFLVSFQDTMDFRATRLGAFRVIGIVSVLQALVVNTTRAVAGLIYPAAASLIVVTTLSYGAQASMLRLSLKRRSSSNQNEQPVPFSRMLRKYRDFPLLRMPADMINATSQTVPVFLLSVLFSPAATGLYVLARAVVSLPINLIGTAAGNVFYARISEMARNGDRIYPFILKATIFQLAIPGSMILASAVIFPYIFSTIFGESWRAAGEYAQWMSLWVVCMLVNIPSVRALPAIGRQNLHLYFNIAITIMGMLKKSGGR